jgi:dihydroorotate dehydrogenase (NAD+) catalytic subunit
MVYEVARCVSIPVLAVGGARSAEDVLEFLCAGAAAVQIGTAVFADPALLPRIVEDLQRLLSESRTTLAEIRGAALPRPAATPATAASAAGACHGSGATGAAR